MKIALIVSALVAVSLALRAAEKTLQPTPLSPSRVFPEHPWTFSEKEATSWSGPFAASLRVLLKAGFPDPKGLPFHRIGIVTGNCYTGDDGVIETTGWIIPRKEGDAEYAIAWNGLVYPLVGDRGEADLGAEVEKMMKGGEDDRAAWYDTGEVTQVTLGSLALIHGLYLTRLGHPQAAEFLMKNREEPLKEPPLAGGLAIQWIWNLYDRAVCAHMRGDPNMALASLATCRRGIASMEKVLEPVDPMFGSVSSWKEDIPLLEQECERRLNSGKVGGFDAQAYVASEHTVAELIDALDRIAISQPGQPADVPLWESDIVKALVKKGDEAVEPLLACLESDPRLTQSVHFWRSHHRSRTILGVHEAALYALQALLETEFFELGSTGDSLSSRDPEYRKELAAEIRAAWKKYGRTTGVRRGFKVLMHDDAGIDAWMDAGNALFKKEEYDEEKDEWVLPPGPNPGEVLREFRDPSVSDLLEKRANEAGKLMEKLDEKAGHGRMALLAILLKWDRERGRAAIARLADAWLANDSWSKEKIAILPQFVEEVADDVPEILPVFEKMAWSLNPGDYESMNYRSGFVTSMMTGHGAGLKRKDLWTDPDSPWCLKKLDLSKLEDVIGCWLERELLEKQPFRELVIELLQDESQCGEVYIKTDEPETVWLRRESGSNGHQITRETKLGLKPGEVLAVRRKDVAARRMKEPRWLPEESEEELLEYYWPVADRDAFVAKVLAEIQTKPAEQGK